MGIRPGPKLHREIFKGIVNMFQTRMSFFLLLNTKDILKNVGNHQTVDGRH